MMVYLSLILAFASAVNAANPTVTLGGTTLVGRDVVSLQQDFFGGIPFAKAPVGELRLKPPVKAELSEGNFDASNFSAFCLQPGFPLSQMSEDCLTINVFRPSGVSEGANLPVLFWTYGGGFEAGSANIYNSSAIVAQSALRGTPVIVVTHNYRLGPLGFPQGAEADSKGALNLALRDQVAALEWVQENICHFGGDKDKVTIFGESAGAILIAVQFLNPDFSKLVRAGIFESGSAATPIEHTAEVRESVWTNFVAGVPECASVANTSNTFDCLKTANTSSILQGLVASINEADELFPYNPTLDGPGGFLPDRPSNLLKQGRFAKVPFIAGTNLDEGTFITPMDANMDYGDQNLRLAILKNLSPPDVSAQTLNDATDRILELYPDIPALGSPFNTGNETFGLPQGYKRWAAINGDVSFQSQRRLWQQTASNAGVKTYGYLFTQPQPGNGPRGVAHGSEVLYVFGGVTNATDVPLSRLMIDYWVSFATSLDPNDGKGLPRPTWDSYTPDNQVLMELNSANTKLIPDDYRKEQIDFINQNPITFLHRRWML
ncbi:hypothetical protein AAF712_007756 [Marasmius tenuissimus]|uniref:Carboxylic ester hydrolase n=1 Tax=Marasmius tenuissimus TaxID=585030 RepID=A0ABR2ZVA5_9AGAR